MLRLRRIGPSPSSVYQSLMRHLLAVLLVALCLHAGAQSDRFSYRHNFAFIEDGPTLVPLKGDYRVEQITRGQYWTVTDTHAPVNHPGTPRRLTPCITVQGTPLLVVEMAHSSGYPDNKLRVVRGVDTMIVDLNLDGRVEQHLLDRMAKLGAPPRPPVLLPFRKGWFTNIDLVQEAQTIANTEQLDALWAARRNEVLALYDTARHSISLEMDGLHNGPLSINIDRDPNYARHLLEFPASGPGTRFELYLNDSLGVASTTCSLRVDMPAGGETSTWVDVTDMPYGRYTVHLKWEKEESLFYLGFGW